MPSLYEISATYQRAFLELAEIADESPEAVADTLEAIEGEFAVKAANVAAWLLNQEAEVEAIKQAEERMRTRRKALEARTASLRDYLKRNMIACGISEIKALDNSFRARLMAGRESVVVDDEDALPEDCKRITVKVDPDKTRILKLIKAGESVPGARVEKNPSLRID